MCWDLHSSPLQFGDVDNWQHNWIHLNTLYSNNTSHGLETRSDPSPDSHGHHALSKVQQCDISEEALVDDTQYHC